MSEEEFEGYRLSPQQERLWFLCRGGDASAYRSQCAALIEGDFDSEPLQAAVNRVIARHEILRTSLRSVEAMSLPLQVISESARAVIEMIDLAALSGQEQARQLELLYERDRQARLDYQCGGALEVTLAKISESRQVMVVSAGSVWSDKKGLKNVIRHVISEYEGKARTVERDVQYADVSEIFNELLESERTEAGREYWRRRAESRAGEMRLVVERNGKGEFRPKIERREVSEELRVKVKEICESVGVSEEAVMLSLFGIMISRMSGERDVRVGVSYDGRTFEGLREAVGVYARYLPVDISLDERVAFSDLAKFVDESAQEFYKWQNYFNWRQVLTTNGSYDDEICFPYLFEYEAEESKYSSGAISYSIERQYSCIDRFKVKLSCYMLGDDLAAEFHYDSTLYDPADISQLADHYLTLLQSAAQGPHGIASRLEILSARQREKLLNEFNQTRRDYAASECVHELIEGQAELRPEAVAVVCGRREVSYKELNSRANRLANYLRNMGVGPERVVGVMVSWGIEMVVGALGVMKAGAAYLPLDADYPKQRLTYMLQDARVSLLLTERQYADHLPEHNATVIYLDMDWEIISRESDANPTSQVNSQNLVYVIYTSGSTGNPKGAMLTHGGIVNCLCWMQETYQLDATDRFLMKTSLNFDPSVWELFWPLWVGGAVILAESQRRHDTTYLTELILEREATSAYFVPSMLRVFINEPGLAALRSLRRVICGGESLSIETVNNFFDKLNAKFHHSYGPTETSIAATEWNCQRDSEHLIAPIGKPLGNTQVYILDAMMQPTPIGVPGELYIGGICVGRGYLNRADMTAERFVPDLFSIEPGARFYKSGDVARFLPDGNVAFIGRLDNQVKLRGYRIELGEIEATLRSHPKVREAVVEAREDGSGEKRLVGYVVGEEGLRVRELREYLLGKLPEYMVPSAYALLAELPLAPNGKVNRQALPRPELGEGEQEYEAPHSPVEEIVAGIFTEVLNLKRIGVKDNFFDLGGHSLLVTQVISRVRVALKVELALRALFESPTVRELARRVESAPRQELALTGPALGRADRLRSLPLSFAQQRLWFIDQLEPGSALYNVLAALRLGGELDVAALERSLQEIVRRHEALRTSFVMVAGEPAQVISADWRIAMPVLDLSPLAAPQRMEVAERLANEEAERPFYLSRGPLLRAELLRLGERDHALVMVMHHIVSDGWSEGVVIKELTALYEAYSRGDDAPLEELQAQYADFAVWQREWLTGDVLEQQLSYWREQLTGLEPLNLPTDRPRPSAPSHRGGVVPFSLLAEETSQLVDLSRREGVTLFMTLLAGFQLLLSRYCGQEDIAVGTVVANRNHAETEGLIGFFVNQLALRTDLGGDPSFRGLVKRVREVTLGAYAHQDLPFERLVEELSPQRDLSRSPLFQVSLVFQNTPQYDLWLGDLTLQRFGIGHSQARFDLNLTVGENGDGLIGVVEYASDLFEASTIERFVEHLRVVLRQIARNPDQPISEINYLTESERSEVLDRWNATAREYPTDLCLHEAFELQVGRSPDAIAIVFQERQLSYRWLNEQANQLARYLRELGVGPEVWVGICIERGPELMVGLLGILKAGGAYLPIDPTYPEERQTFMLEDSQAAVFLTKRRSRKKPPMKNGRVVYIDDCDEIEHESKENLDSGVKPHHPAYMIYTSGSTGKPKGVIVEHRNVMNFFTGMDERIGGEAPGVWLAVTSISFDISVLELFWTLARGFKVVLHVDEERGVSAGQSPPVRDRKMDFSLFYFASDYEDVGGEKYRLLLEGAKLADQLGFSAIWTPERHFHTFGGLYPNPSVTSAAIAAITERIQIRAGSVVLPLHSPIRVAEEWAVVDNLSKGRVGISFASGWHDRDFVFEPENYARRREIMYDGIETVRKLWRGELVTSRGGAGSDVEVKIFPKPVRRELPVWITAAGSPETFRMAGAMGFNLLTHLLGQDLKEAAANISIYRDAWRKAGHKGSKGHVTLMVHTYLGESLESVREKARKPFCNYLRESVDLFKQMAMVEAVDIENLEEEDMDALLSQAFDFFFETRSLLGTPESCLEMLESLKGIGVDEVACLIDFGVDVDSVLSGLSRLNELRELSNERKRTVEQEYSLSQQIERHSVSHLQCTPSMAQMLSLGAEGGAALRSLQKLMLGGETLTESFGAELGGMVSGEIHNMYGPTETTIWSTTHLVGSIKHTIPIGRPVANTRVYILDRGHQPAAIGISGELLIGGAGVVRGYLNRPELTAERFVPDPFSGEAGARLYRTGDDARWRSDGNLEFRGRLDHQVKLRGYRIELGEIEAVLSEYAGVRQAVVAAREDEPGEKRLVGYVVCEEEIGIGELRQYLQGKLPEYMTPSAFVTLKELPLTPNGKVDRKSLPRPEALQHEAVVINPRDIIEIQLKSIWEEILGIDDVGIRNNFFELGGHSLKAVSLSSRLTEKYQLPFPVRNVFEFPTIEEQAAYLKREPSITSPSLIIPIQPRGSRTPVFCVHPGGGWVGDYISLAYHLGKDQPFYGIQCIGLEDGRSPARTVESMAEAYLAEMKTIQSVGPYQIAGWSLGGAIAYEMAVQLSEAGEQVSLLAVIDKRFDEQALEEFSTQWADIQWEELLMEAEQAALQEYACSTYGISPEAFQLLAPEERIRRCLMAAKSLDLIPSYVNLDQFRRFARVLGANLIAETAYHPRPYQGIVTLFRAPVKDGVDPLYGLGPLAIGGVKVYEAPGDHYTLLREPNVGIIAEKLQESILKQDRTLMLDAHG